MPLDFRAHRQRLLDRLGPDEAVLLFGTPHRIRNGDTEYGYRPDSDVWWLTGWEDPEVALFVRPGQVPVTMFVQPRNPEREQWEGSRPGPDGAKERFGADAAFPFEELGKELVRLVQGVSTLHYAFARDADHDALVTGAIHKAARAARKSGLDVPETFVSPSRLLHELRLFKSPDELEVMRDAARISTLAHRAAMAFGRPGRNEREIQALVEWLFRREGGNGPGYGTIVGAGANACTLHYVKNRETLRDGDLLLLDAGCEVDFYTADVTRTFPVSGRFTPPQRRVYEHVLDAQLQAIDVIRAGGTFQQMHDAAARRLTEGMVDLGLLTGSVDELLSTEKYKRYYPHGTGHWLGLDVHDVGRYAGAGKSRSFEAGMIVTVEPGLYVPLDDRDAPEALRGIGVRIEDDVLVTPEGPVVLTADCPKTVDAVEAACGDSSAIPVP